MGVNRKYLVAVALLAVLAVVFGLAGTVMPVSELGSPQQSSLSSNSVAHFMNPPTYNSSWLDITDKAGQYFNVTHNLNSTDVIVDITGKTTMDGGVHQKHLGGTDYTPGWSKTYGGTNNDDANSVVQASDGGYAIAGNTESFGSGNADFWLIKTDASGNMQWNKTYGGADNDYAWSVVQTGDGGYAIACRTYSFGSGNGDFWLVKTDSNGNMQWNQTYGGTSDDGATSVVQASDGGYAIAGYTESFGSGNGDFWLVKTDSNGNMQWNQTYGGTSPDGATSVVQASDGGYAIAGNTYSFGSGNADFWLIKTDASGNMQWNKTYGGTSWDSDVHVVQTSDGGYAIAGYTMSFGAGNRDFWLVKTDSNGNMQWNQTYGGTNDDWAISLVQTNDGGYALVGHTWSFGVNRDVWLVKTDSNGNMQWNQTYGGTNQDNAQSLVQTSDGGYALAGWTYSFGSGNGDFWLVKTEVETGLAWTDSTNNTITLYRGRTDAYWNFVRVRIWTIKEPTWMFGDINQDGVVDAEDLYIVSRNYGKTFSLLSLTGIIGIASVYTYKKRKKQPE